jgi:hypothetical protein
MPQNNEMQLTGGEGCAHDGQHARARVIIESRSQLISGCSADVGG